jgi:hypothetical protein
LRLNELLVEQDGIRHIVHYWFRSHRRTGLLGLVDNTLDRLASRLLTGRADGALVRVSGPVIPGKDVQAQRARLLAFAAAIDAQLADHWPAERERARTR